MVRELPSYTPHDHMINLVGGDPLKSLIYKLSKKKLGVLKEYLDNNLSKDWIHKSTSLLKAGLGSHRSRYSLVASQGGF